MPDFNLILTGLSIILFVNALWLLFMGGYTDRTHAGAFKSYDFASHPYRFSAGVGLTLALALLCLHLSHPGFIGVLAGKVPQLKIIYQIAKMKNGTIYLFAGATVICTILAYIIRQFLLGVSTFTRGDELDLNKKAKKAWQAKVDQEELDFEKKHGSLKNRLGGEHQSEE